MFNIMLLSTGCHSLQYEFIIVTVLLGFTNIVLLAVIGLLYWRLRGACCFSFTRRGDHFTKLREPEKKTTIEKIRVKPKVWPVLHNQPNPQEMRPRTYGIPLLNVQSDRHSHGVDDLTSQATRDTEKIDMRRAKSEGVERAGVRSPVGRAKKNKFESSLLITDHVTHTTFGHTNRDKSPSRKIRCYEAK